MNRAFIDKQMSVMFEQIRIMRDLLDKLEMRMEEVEYELEDIDFNIDYDPINQPSRVTNLPYEARPKYCMCDECWGVRKNECDCPDCREDASYRMD